MLQRTSEPITGTQLSERLSVSRQVIVQDITVLKSSGYEIISTNKGYILPRKNENRRVVKVFHTDSQIEDELFSVVDLGGKVVNVFVKHKVYGTIYAPLQIASRRDVSLYLDNIKTGKSTPLKNVTANYHYHTIEAASSEILDLIVEELNKKGFLAEYLDYEQNDLTN